MTVPPATGSSLRRRIAPAAAVVLTAVGALRIASTYTVFTQTYDEPSHIAAGVEWWDKGTYTLESLHVPLARLAAGAGPYADGVRFTARPDPVHPPDMWEEGNKVLYARGTYTRNLALARLGILPFFLLGSAVVFLWTRAAFGSTAAVLATALFTTLPPILAHGGIATTDMALTATLAAALYAFSRWLDRPTLGRAVTLGVAVGVTALSKMSSVVFLPACILALLAVRWLGARRRRGETRARPTPGLPTQLGAAVVTAALVLWAGYRFAVGPLAYPGEPQTEQGISRVFGADGKAHDLALAALRQPVYPAPAYLRGVIALFLFNQEGRSGYLLGESYHGGRWYFFPVALGVKTPIAFLVLLACGLAFVAIRVRRVGAWHEAEPAAAGLVLLLVVIAAGSNLGLRHVLPIYPLLSMVAGAGAVSLWAVRRARPAAAAAAALLVAWHVASSVRAHPDYLAYFNEIAEGHAEHFLLDSDLDWGQDLKRLADTLRARGVPEVAIRYWGTADVTRHGLPPTRPLEPGRPTSGWVAISAVSLYGSNDFAWLRRHRPVARVGRSIRLFYVPAPDVARRRPAAGRAGRDSL